MQKDFSFNRESFNEMLGQIRDRAGGNEVIYVFVDNAGYHSGTVVDPVYKELNMVPVFNVGYQYQLNPVERLWAKWKFYFRRILLEKMLKCPAPRQFPMKEALWETFTYVDVKDSIPKYIRKA